MPTKAMIGTMGGDVSGLTKAEAASLLGWWMDAGVDLAIAEYPRQWLKQKPLQPGQEVAADAPQPELAPASTPVTERGVTLDAFHSWLRQASDLPLFRSGSARALPHGPAEAEIMLVADMPTRDCAGEGRPIGGDAWALTVRMLAAIGLKPEQAYVASLACFPSPANRIEEREIARCAEDMLHHIRLVRPKRLLLLGDSPARAITGQPTLQARGRIHRIGGIPAVATLHPRQLLQRPGDKAYAWRDLLLLMGEEV